MSENYTDFNLIRDLHGSSHRISSRNLKVGDRFIYGDENDLYFKTDALPQDNKYLCCNESGKLRWISEQVKVVRINGVFFELRRISRGLKLEYFTKVQENEETTSRKIK